MLPQLIEPWSSRVAPTAISTNPRMVTVPVGTNAKIAMVKKGRIHAYANTTEVGHCSRWPDVNPHRFNGEPPSETRISQVDRVARGGLNIPSLDVIEVEIRPDVAVLDHRRIVADFGRGPVKEHVIERGRRAAASSRNGPVGNIPIVKLPEALLAGNRETVWPVSRGILFVVIDDLKPVLGNGLARGAVRAVIARRSA